MLSFVWSVPLTHEEAERVLDRGRTLGLLRELDNSELGAEWASAQDFLTSYPERPHRFVLAHAPSDAPVITVADARVPCDVVVTWHPAYRALTFIAAMTVDPRAAADWPTRADLAIALQQSLQGRPSAEEVIENASHRSIRATYAGTAFPSARECFVKVFGELTEGTKAPSIPPRTAWCVEVRGYDGVSPKDLVESDHRPFYGLATGDEGWRFVPDDVAKAALGEPWGTRSFVATYAMASGVVCLNNKGSAYVERQRDTLVRFFGRPEPYFGIDSSIGGLDHGILFTLERVLIRMALADKWLRRAQREAARDGSVGRQTSDRRRLTRGSLDVLEMMNTVLPAEVDALERRLATSMGIETIIQKLDRHAEAMDEETRYSYENAVNLMVTRLTWVAVGLTLITIVLGVMQIMVTQ